MTDDRTEPFESRGGSHDVDARASVAIGGLVGRAAARGWLAMLGGAALLVHAARSARTRRGRAVLSAFAGGALLAVGVRQRRATRAHEASTDEEWTLDESVADLDAGSDEPTDRDDRSGPEAAVDRDPRVDGDDGEGIDRSDSATADEPGEATGPAPEQAQPVQTEATEPESAPDADAPADEREADAFGQDETDVESSDDESPDDETTATDEATDDEWRQDETDVEPSDEES